MDDDPLLIVHLAEFLAPVIEPSAEIVEDDAPALGDVKALYRTARSALPPESRGPDDGAPRRDPDRT